MRQMRRVVFLITLIVVLSITSVASAKGGFDEWGYNYGAHMFNGTYCDAYKNAPWCQAYAEDNLLMKWNDAWLSSEDLNGDGSLDRHFGLPSYIGSGAWLTNHQTGVYLGDDGAQHTWTYFVKIVAMPSAGFDCTQLGGYSIWGEFCVVQEIYNDAYAGSHGVLFKPVAPGLGNL